MQCSTNQLSFLYILTKCISCQNKTAYLASFPLHFINKILHSVCVGLAWIRVVPSVNASVWIREWSLHEHETVHICGQE